MQIVEQHQAFAGEQRVYSHTSAVLNCSMRVAVYLPPQALAGAACPLLYWLSGLTCNEQNFICKAAAQRYAAAYGIIVVAPDTSPRGAEVADDASYDLGQGAGFYVDALQQPWAQHFKMYSYIVAELPELLAQNFKLSAKQGIFGHSMGGHGALQIAIKNPDKYHSVSAFAPIAAPSQVPWGQKALGAYLGANPELWQQYDSAWLIANLGYKLPILVDQGSADEFLPQLQPESLQKACAAAGVELQLNMRAGYDHSYYFISSFIGEHFAHHAKFLLK